MKTTLVFTDSIDKRKVILKHKKDVLIFKETRKDHHEWTDGYGNPILNRRYIVIRFPKTKKIDLNNLKLKRDDRIVTGYLVNELQDDIEILFYDRVTFTWVVYQLEKIGLFKVSQRIIPDFKRNGEIFPCYINARGIKEWSYNIFFGLIQSPFEIYKQIKRSKEKTSIF